MKTYYITNRRVREVTRRLEYKGGAETVRLDYTAWAEDNGAPSTVTVSVESGGATVANETLSSSIKTFVITTADTGRSMLKITATAGNNIDVQFLEVMALDADKLVDDYGACA